MKRSIALIHASPAALPPLIEYYAAAAPDLQVTNLLDDGVMRLFTAGEFEAAEARLREMLTAARDVYAAELALLTCSAVPRRNLESLRAAAGLPLLKIDEPMARKAVSAGRRIGVAVSFPPTLEMARKLLLDTAAESGREVDLDLELLPQASAALLSGDHETHDRLLLDGVRTLAGRKAEVIVLAQVSMARVLERAAALSPVPVLTSLETSLEAVREALK